MRIPNERNNSKGSATRQRIQGQIAIGNNSIVGFGHSSGGNETVTNSPSFLNNVESPMGRQFFETGDIKAKVEHFG